MTFSKWPLVPLLAFLQFQGWLLVWNTFMNRKVHRIPLIIAHYKKWARTTTDLWCSIKQCLLEVQIKIKKKVSAHLVQIIRNRNSTSPSFILLPSHLYCKITEIMKQIIHIQEVEKENWNDHKGISLKEAVATMFVISKLICTVVRPNYCSVYPE